MAGVTSPYPHLRQSVHSRSLAPSTDPAVRRFALIKSQPREGGVVLLRYGAAP
jgi:hypothetical protein